MGRGAEHSVYAQERRSHFSRLKKPDRTDRLTRRFDDYEEPYIPSRRGKKPRSNRVEISIFPVRGDVTTGGVEAEIARVKVLDGKNAQRQKERKAKRAALLNSGVAPVRRRGESPKRYRRRVRVQGSRRG